MSCATHSPAAVFVDVSTTERALWARGYPRSSDVSRAAAEEFVATAVRAVAAVESAPPGSVQVIGRGLLAQLVEKLLPASFGAERPRAVIETTGAEASLNHAIGAVETLGTVVLAAPVDAEIVQVAGYADLHVRGLTVVGVPWATQAADQQAELVDWALGCLAESRDGEPTPSAPWCRYDT